MDIKLLSPHDVYAEQIKTFLSLTFPSSISNDRKVLLETLTSLIIGSKQSRYGAIQDPESLVSLREVINGSISNGDSIPIIVPWGGSKQSSFLGVDIADVCALKQIQCMYNRVLDSYKPGLNILIRLEDLTDKVIFGVGERDAQIENYTIAIQKLIKILNIPVKSFLESEIMGPHEFLEASRKYGQTIFMALNQKTEEKKFHLLKSIGWTGIIPEEQFNYYVKCYAKFYPTLSVEKRFEKICMYFGSSLARKNLHGTGVDKWAINLSFAPPIPGAPGGRRIYYRTIPERFTNCHKAPWIGKGYLRIKGRKIYPNIAGWDGEGFNYQPMKIELTNDKVSTIVDADYVIEE